MSNWPFRFLHAADFHLETPPFGLEEVPEHLTELFVDAAYRAVERVVEIALAENVDFVVLSGDLLHARQTGPRGPLFLVEQFGRLAEHGTMVYWAGGRIDSAEAWPVSIALPENVHFFGRATPSQWIHRRGDTPIARLIGASRSADGEIRPQAFEPEHPGLFSIAVVHGAARLDALKACRVDYWALGGRHSRRTLCESMPVVHDPGTPQGRRPDQTGSHGCALVEVDMQREVRMTHVPTDAIRFETRRIELDESRTREWLEREMERSVESLRQEAAGRELLVEWRVAGRGELVDRLRRDGLAVELLHQLQERFGAGDRPVWSTIVEVEPPADYPESWREEDTVRGHFLRELERRRQEADEPLGLDAFLPKDAIEGPLGRLLAEPAGSARESLLAEAAALGVELLTDSK